MPTNHKDALAAAAIAFEAGQLLVALQNDKGGRTPDVASDELIAKRLREQFPNDAVLSEESADSPRRLGRERVWIIDPLDGSREYGEGRSDWAVHVALFESGALSAGAVALPARGMLFSSAVGFRAPEASNASTIRVAVSRTRPPEQAERVKDALGVELVAMGSAGAKAMAVVLGEVEAYLHAGGQWEWDSAAPVAVASACGLHVSRIDGSAFTWNQRRPWQPDLLICKKELAEILLKAVAS